MKIIDMRFRPPYKAFQNDAIFDLQATPARYARRGITPSQALMELSMEKCLEEMNTAGIVKGVIPRVTFRSRHRKSSKCIKGISRALHWVYVYFYAP